MDIKTKLQIMEEYSLTAEEQLVADLLFLASAEENQKEFLYNFYNNKLNTIALRNCIESLQEKGVILKSYKIPPEGSSFDPENIEFNRNYLNKYRKYSGILGQEFFNEYPHFINIKGITYNLTNYAKKFNSEEDFYYSYGKSIGWNLEKHRFVLDLIRWGKENTNFINTNIADFVISKGWDRLQELKDGKFSNLTLDNTICL